MSAPRTIGWLSMSAPRTIGWLSMSAPRTIGWSARFAGPVLAAAMVGSTVASCTSASTAEPTVAARDDAGSVAVATTSDAWRDLEVDLAARTNEARSQRGLDELRVVADLTDVARFHTTRMADDDHLHHNPHLTDDVTGWHIVGENVGRGPSVAALHEALMDSPSHRDNILDERYTQLGIGIARRDGAVWVTQVFRTPEDIDASG